MDTDVCDVMGIPTEQLEHEIRQFAANIAAATCRWLLLVAELDRRETWRSWGSRSCAHWLSWHCGIAMPTGREQVRVAATLTSLPITAAAFAQGELSYAKVRALTRIATPDNEDDLVGLARDATASQLETIVRAFRRCATKGLSEANARFAKRFVRCRHDDDGSLVIHARIPPEIAPTIENAIASAVEALREGLPESGRPSPSQLAADGLVAVCEAAIAHELGARPGTDRTLVKILVSAETVTHDDPDGICQVVDGPSIARETARRLLCDTATIPVIEAIDGTPIGAGRTQRTCSRRQRRALLARNGTCRFPGCNHSRYIDIHHVEHWIDGGPTLLPNLLPLCWYHHRAVHEGGFTVEASGAGMIFRRPNGDAIGTLPRCRAQGDVRDECRADGDAIRARCNGEAFDLGLTIDALFGLGCDVSAEASDEDQSAMAG